MNTDDATTGEHDPQPGALDHETKAMAAVPADLSKTSLVGWVSLLRVTALGLPPSSVARQAFLALAVKNLGYAAWLLRGSKTRAEYLKAEALKLPDLATTISD